ncbi:iron chaperone [Cellulomonas hominis]
MAHPTSVDGYLDALPPDQRDLLRHVRSVVTRLLPDAQERISYGMPTVVVDGKDVVWFAGWTSHCALYPLTEEFWTAHSAELTGHRRTKGSLHFSAAAPLSDALVEDFVQRRLAALGVG